MKNRVPCLAALWSALLATAALAQGAPELWSVPINGDLRAWVAGCDDAPTCPLFLLVADPRDDAVEANGTAEVGTPANDDPESDRKEWSIFRWSPNRGGEAIRILGPMLFERQPEIDRVIQQQGPVLTLFGDRQLWLLPVSDLTKDDPPALGPPDLTDRGELRGRIQATLQPDIFSFEAVGEVAVLGADGSRISFSTPVDIQRGPAAFALRSPPITRLSDGRWVLGPQSQGDRRLRTLLIDPARPPVVVEAGASEPAAGNPEELWSLLPGPERVVDSHYEVIGGRLLLFATVLRSDKMGMIEKKKLRIFELQKDRTRTGRPPIFEILTSSRMWQDLKLHVVDVDNDGERDLVLLQPEGMGGEKLIIDIHLATSSGNFNQKSLRSVLPEVSEDTPHLYGHDWNDDDVPDLVSVENGVIRLYPGLAEPTRKKVVGRESIALLEVPRDRSIRDLGVSGQRLVGRLSGEGSALLVALLDP